MLTFMQELQLDPYTFSPQLAVQLGKIISINSEQAVVQRMERYETEGDGEDISSDQEPEVVISLSDLYQSGKYKVVKLPS